MPSKALGFALKYNLYRHKQSNNLPPGELLMSTKIAVTPEKIMQLGLGFWSSKAFLSAVELGIFTELAQSPLTGDQLMQRLQLHPRSAQDFFDALVSLGVLERQDGLYRNTPDA